MEPNDLSGSLAPLIHWSLSTWPGHVVLVLVVLAVVLPRLVRGLKNLLKATLVFLPLVLTFGSAIVLEQPRSFDVTSSACASARQSMPTAGQLGAGFTSGPVVPVKLRLASDTTDLSWLERYWSIRCALSGTFHANETATAVGVMDYATAAQAVARVDQAGSRSGSTLPGTTHALIGPVAQSDGTMAAEVQLAVGRLFADIVVDVPGQSTSSQTRALGLATHVALVTFGGMPRTHDTDATRPFRDHLARVWAAWLIVLALLPAVLLSFLDDDRRRLLVMRLMVLGIELHDATGLGARLGMTREPRAPGSSVVPQARAVRLVRAASSLASVALWAGALLLLLHLLPAAMPLSVTSAMIGGAYLIAELIRTALLGALPRYRYLRVASWGEGLRRLASLLVDATYLGLVVYAAGRLALAWIWTPVVVSGSGSAIGPIVYMWLFGPLAFLAVSALLRALSRRVQARDAEATLRQDARPQVLYLRSFGDDRHEIPVHRSVYESFGQLFDWSRKLRFEEVLVRRLWRYGPVLAIGRPGEARPPLGATRVYYPDDAWQDAVRNWVESSVLVVVTMGKTANLGWELHMLRDLGVLEKVLVVIPPTKDNLGRTRVLVEQLDLEGPWAHYKGIRSPLVFAFDHDGRAQPVYADIYDDVAYELALHKVVSEILHDEHQPAR